MLKVEAILDLPTVRVLRVASHGLNLSFYVHGLGVRISPRARSLWKHQSSSTAISGFLINRMLSWSPW
jgi:hypothetical protein